MDYLHVGDWCYAGLSRSTSLSDDNDWDSVSDYVSDATLSDKEFASLLRDKTFVDYLNVFLSLPKQNTDHLDSHILTPKVLRSLSHSHKALAFYKIFSQRILYKFSKNDFEFDPPLRRTGNLACLHLDRRKLIEWLLAERIPLFLKTDLYVEYTLCHQLLKTKLKIRQSSHHVNYEEDRIKRDSTFLRQMIGHVSGMRKFRIFLDGSAGQAVLQFWLDAEHFWNIPARSEDRRRTLFRDIQAKYFRNGGVLELPDNEKWKAFTERITFEEIVTNDSTHEILNTDMVKARFRSAGTLYGNKDLITRSVFQRAQNLMLDTIKSYWLPKYLIHIRREASSGNFDLSIYPEVDKLDLLNIEDPEVREILEGLEKKHGHSASVLPLEEMAKEKSKMIKMGAMFPHFQDDCPSYRENFEDTDEPLVCSAATTPESDSKQLNSEPESEAMEPSAATTPESDSEQWSSESVSQAIDSLDSLSYKSHRSTLVGSAAGRKVKGRRGDEDGVENQRLIDETILGQSGPSQAVSASTLAELWKPPASFPVQSAERSNSMVEKSSRASVKMKSTAAKTAALTKMNLNTHKLHGRRPPTPEPSERNELELGARLSKEKVFEWLNKSADQSLETARTKRLSSIGASVVLNSETHSWPLTPYAKLTTKSEHEHPMASYPKHEPHKIAIRGMLQSKLATCQNKNLAESDGAINLDTYYLGVVCFRRNNDIFVAAIAADRLAGHPFERFLRTRQHLPLLDFLHFWQDAQMFLSTRPTELDNLGELLKRRRAKILLLKYLHPCGENRIDIGPTLMSSLTQLLPSDEGDDILRHAQDVACQLLRNQWQNFVIADRESFLAAQSSITKDKKSSINTTPRTNAEDAPANLNVRKALKDTIRQSHQIERPRSTMQEDHAGLFEKRMLWALQLAQHASHLYEYELSLGGILEAFSEDDDYGSLKIRNVKEEIVRNKTTRHYLFPPKIDIEKIKVSRRDLKSPECPPSLTPLRKNGEQESNQHSSHTGLPFLKPITKNGVLLERPDTKPTNFVDILDDPVHNEFFRRFLRKESGNDTPVQFWSAVDGMRKSIGNIKLFKVKDIVRQFFGKSAGFGADLCCDADIIREIAKITNVTPLMLISARVCVARSLEERWGDLYGETFATPKPRTPNKEVLNKRKPVVKNTADTSASVRKWNKTNTKILWIKLLKSVAAFRRGILDLGTANMFREFLKNEGTDVDKKTGSNQQSRQSQQNTATLKRVTKNRNIAGDKLPADLNFLIEVEKYRILADAVITQAEDGVYSPAAEELLAKKAKAIIDRYLESEIPPKLQINISPDVAETIVSNYNDFPIERGLFHNAFISTFITLAPLWKKFNAQRKRPRRRYRVPPPKKPVVRTRITPHGSKIIPNYITMDLSKTNNFISHSDDECMRILFSLAHGVRYIMPTPRKRFTKSQVELAHQYGIQPGLENLMSQLKNSVAHRNDGASETTDKFDGQRRRMQVE